ncbi:hypothetical protein D3C75_747040 [compost metagenome]
MAFSDDGFCFREITVVHQAVIQLNHIGTKLCLSGEEVLQAFNIIPGDDNPQAL